MKVLRGLIQTARTGWARTMKKALSTLDISRMLGVAIASVAKWIDQDQLKAGRTPGGHRRVQVEDLLDFLHRQKLPVPRELIPSKPGILIVDDELAVTTWVAEEMSAEFPDCQVYQAHDGYSAGEMVTSLKPSAVVLDLQMPGMDGYEVCKRIKSREDTKHIVVIAMTAHHSPKVEKRILECGAKICLSKPLDRLALAKEVAAAIGGRATQGQDAVRE
jgi:CheY-like chemotaxis protein